MPMAQPYRRAVYAALAVLALTGLASCAMDSEQEVRALVGDWVTLDETAFFKSGMNCTAGVFKLETTRISSLVTHARSVRGGMDAMAEGKPVAFMISGLSPTLVSEQVMTADLPKGLGVLSSGVAGKDCMDDGTKRSYLRALLDPNAVLIFEPTEKFMAVVDRTNARLFFSRGNV
ncbi:hypothetical protein A9Q94_07425 [Rhodobacterales bacterium 56_14_T64]|nr:hypothetical protein A9Q94_07425 [Rhodobacterales bacterium 56_14_T64]